MLVFFRFRRECHLTESEICLNIYESLSGVTESNTVDHSEKNLADSVGEISLFMHST